jgi:hypothetical protein
MSQQLGLLALDQFDFMSQALGLALNPIIRRRSTPQVNNEED